MVVLGAAGLSTAVQQQLTREVRQFETVFVGDVDLASRTAQLRVFTEDEELDFAGHPILGAGAVLHSLLESAGDEEIWALQLGSRTVTVRTRGHVGWVDASMDQGPVQFGRIVTGELADRYRRALGLMTETLHPELPMQVASTGLPYLIVPVQPAGMAAAAIQTPDFEALLAECGAKFVYVLDPAAAEGRTWDNAGRVEDVATGSAAGPAAGYLIEHGLHPAAEPFAIAQGRFHRPAQHHRGPPRGERRAHMGGRPGGAGGRRPLSRPGHRTAITGRKLRIMPKRLISLSSIKGKTPEQVASELLAYHAKYQAEMAKHLPEDPANKSSAPSPEF